ncbi:hypothetical protein [Actinomycetospora termitidis]|uniref:Uncharacterized protein n=1 Tax=Actinomycetospora termitidis TaxID=3053470 RepID=A0ABT7MHE7_9PSEU|nr:hypothetical protein [Actinomycetospora sp. Odt1-22]MDL5158758.1 hypothetical protein [Actinomycetospora sp. Odt1-22]
MSRRRGRRSCFGLGAALVREAFIEFSQVAELYAQLAGVLAGFAFAALIAIASVRLAGNSPYEESITAAYRPLMCSFFGLVAASLNYSIVAGMKERNGLASAIEATAGVSFCAAGCLLIFSIFVTLDSVETGRKIRNENADKAVSLVRRLLVAVIPPLFVILFLPAIRDHSLIAYGTPAGSPFLRNTAILAVVVSGLIGIAFGLVFKRMHRYRSGVDVISVPGVTTAILATLVTGGLVSFLSPSSVVPDIVPFSELVIVALLGLLTSYAACVFQDSPASAQHVPEQRRGGADDLASGPSPVGESASPQPESGRSVEVVPTAVGFPSTDGPAGETVPDDEGETRSGPASS